MTPVRRLAAFAMVALCAAWSAALADVPATTLADGRVGRIFFRAPAGSSTLASLVNQTHSSSDIIWADLVLPAGHTEAVPAVVISHGSGGLNNREYEWAELFASMGVAVFVIDHFSGRGISNTAINQSILSSAVGPADALTALGLLATHPRIDARRVGHIGFSRGGDSALMTAYERLRAAILPSGQRFALHIPFYTGGRVTANRLTGAPIRIFMGDLDGYNRVETIRALTEQLQAAGGDVALTVYPGAHHIFDATYPVAWSPNNQVFRNCTYSTNIDTLVTIDTSTGIPITDLGAFVEACRTLGVYTGMNAEARVQARQAVWSFVRQQFGLASLPATVRPLFGAEANQTALWWNRLESGWGVNLNHQGDIVFGTLFTYDTSRLPLWLVMSAGSRKGLSSTFSGDLYRTKGPAFNANPFTPIGAGDLTTVGKMVLTFSGAGAATIIYTVDGVTVSKAIEPQLYGSRAATCVSSTGSRMTSTNFQDLWWNPAESGWGLNITHQDNTLFATLFTYDAGGKGLWLVMSKGDRQPDGSFQGELYRTSGPAFNAVPFTGVAIATVGSMSLRFSDGNNGTLTYTYNGVTVTKQITRQVFANTVPACS